MTNQNFTTTFSVDQTPEESFKAINNVRGWWSKEIEGSTDKLGAEFKYHYKDVHRCKMQITEFVPGQKVVWLVLDNYFNFAEDKNTGYANVPNRWPSASRCCRSSPSVSTKAEISKRAWNGAGKRNRWALTSSSFQSFGISDARDVRRMRRDEKYGRPPQSTGGAGTL